MKLQKSPAGMLKIILYYTLSGAVVLFLGAFIISKIGVFAGLGTSLVLGFICGILGGKLEYTEHCAQKGKRRKVPEEAGRIIPFSRSESLYLSENSFQDIT